MGLNVDRDLLRRVVQRAERAGGPAEIFLEHRLRSSARFTAGELRDPSCGATLGAGIRTTGGGRRLVHLESPDEERLLQAADRLRDGEGGPEPAARVAGRRVAASDDADPAALLPAGLAAALGQVERGALETDGRVVSAEIEYDAWRQEILIYGSEGRLVEDTRAAVRITVRAAALRGDRCEEGIARAGCADPADLFASVSTREIGKRAGASALSRLEAIACPSGELPVIFANRCGGALFHEALGHALESDFVLRAASPYAGLVGEPIASPLLTLIDDPTLPGRRGSYSADDEGTPARRTVLLKEGVLRGFLTDRAGAAALGVEPSGNGRRASYRDAPMPRMSNLVVDGWKDDPDDILRATRDGLYVVELGGARVALPGGEFTFEVAEGYRIQDGRLGPAVEGAVLVGRGPEVLRRIDRVGADFVLDPGAGSCDKDGQRLPISLGQPTLRVSRLTVRGTAPGRTHRSAAK